MNAYAVQNIFKDQAPVWWPSSLEFSSKSFDASKPSCEKIRDAMRQHFQLAWELRWRWQASVRQILSFESLMNFRANLEGYMLIVSGLMILGWIYATALFMFLGRTVIQQTFSCPHEQWQCMTSRES